MERYASAGQPAFAKRLHYGQKLAPVITIVLYFGSEEWKKPFVANYPINLIQIAHLPKEVRSRLKSDFRLLAEYAACKNSPVFILDNLEDGKTRGQILDKLVRRFSLDRETSEALRCALRVYQKSRTCPTFYFTDK